MPSVDRDLEEIVNFCQRFSANLERIGEEANTLQGLGGQINASLSGTEFATRSSDAVASTAKQVKTAVDQGEQRIRELQRKVEQEIEERDRLSR